MRTIWAEKQTVIEYIQRATDIHGTKYDYSLLDHTKGILEKQKIICPVHGVFEQNLNGHINNKHGCSKCGNDTASAITKMSTEEFIIKARKLHGDDYTYEKTVVNGMHEKVIITCPEHGDFLMLAWNHINPSHYEGCNKCRLLSKEEFIEKSSKIHNGKYNYDKVVWKSTKHQVIITCPVHGDFYSIHQDIYI